ncbi:MAG: DinB family protein [Actinomycetota bacterium]
MSPSPLDDAFAHHIWATLRLIDACLTLTPEQLNAPVPGTYGSILDTMRHSVGGDTYYLSHLTGDPARDINTEHMDLRELRAAMEADERTWIELLAQDLDPNAVVKDVDEEGYERDATIGIRLAQALHHGSDHRSQICTALTMLGIEPPFIDVWAFGAETGRVVEIPPTS